MSVWYTKKSLHRVTINMNIFSTKSRYLDFCLIFPCVCAPILKDMTCELHVLVEHAAHLKSTCDTRMVCSGLFRRLEAAQWSSSLHLLINHKVNKCAQILIHEICFCILFALSILLYTLVRPGNTKTYGLMPWAMREIETIEVKLLVTLRWDQRATEEGDELRCHLSLSQLLLRCCCLLLWLCLILN